ncbi:CBU_0592 family membrane protein [Pedobacter alpinus]|uniref:CBU-0592-like domain-containing protein n=1 Tax=Pedobacter alpinus TaxID=1590643 RepID=A0ABW5TUP9_9SPHI
MSAANWIASIGVGILLIAFFLNISGRLDNKSKSYALFNAIGGLLSGYASWMVDFYPFVILNLIWSFTATLALFKSNVPRETK